MAKKKKRRYKKWFIYTVIGLAAFLAVFLFLKKVPVFVVMNGDKKMTIEVHSEFVDPGAYKRLSKKPITPKGSVDTSKLGKYTLKYSTLLQSFTRTVRVVDTTAPEISLNGREYILMPVNGEYQEAGVTAIDNYDGDISSSVKISGKVDVTKPGTYQVIYTSTDSSKNESTVIRMVNVQEDNFNYVGSVSNDAGISDRMRIKIIRFFDAYYRSLKYLEVFDTSDLFHSEYPENAARFAKGLELTVNVRRDSINDLTLDDCHYDLVISSSLKWSFWKTVSTTSTSLTVYSPSSITLKLTSISVRTAMNTRSLPSITLRAPSSMLTRTLITHQIIRRNSMT